ncbi:Dnaj-like subfamily c member 14 protein [Dioscorea alata]|uniref:Dnaj-like subfamily c member 14 protein n=1 Tax=Dioscorea alata TaxID=55571 RepID=A0ACB7VI97_DIOAL|nr:Dnaj-like subfamily c member 14 protein [Dioscorea alata]
MGDIALWKQAWKWVQSQKQALIGARLVLGFAGDKVVFLVDQLWPMVSKWSGSLGTFFWMLVLQWRDCLVRGFGSLINLGPAALFVIMWSCFLSLTSTACLIYVLLSMGAAGVAIRCLGYTPGLFIVGLFGILMMWLYGNFWITGMLLIVGGYMFFLNHARFLILMSIGYAVYCVHTRVGWFGIPLSLNLAFLSHDLLNKLLQGYDSAGESTNFEECKESEPVMEDFTEDFEYSPPTSEAENVSPCKSSSKTSSTPSLVSIQKDASSSKVVKSDSGSLDEMKRILNSSNHYEALGFPRNRAINCTILRKEYHKKAVLVHPDKNMGNPLASDSFKKLQCAYEVLSDFTKKKNYDEQLIREESGRESQQTRVTSQQEGVAYRSEESRRIECTKCGNSHYWICTNRSKARARWCQECSVYHQAKDGEGWVECGCSPPATSKKVEIPRAFVCAESKIFDVSEWASCQGMVCKENTHRPSFFVNMVGLDKSVPRSNPTRFPFGLDAEMAPEDDEFDLWLQQALAAGLFSETPKRRKSWSPFKMNHKGLKPWRRSP